MSTLSVTCCVRRSTGFELDVTFEAEPGITILFGPSGSGKSTLLRCVSGLTRPDSGAIRIGDRLLFDASAAIDVPVAKRNIGYVFQQLALFPHLSVADNLRYGVRHLGTADTLERIQRIATSFRISHLLDRQPDAISGGERQRTALARSLVTDPAALLLDEPLAALDHRTQTLIIDDLRRWNDARRIPILYVTHAHREAFALGARALVIERGRIVSSGTPHEVLDAPSTELLAAIGGFENFFDAEVRSVSRQAGTMACRVAGMAVDLEVPRLTSAEPGHHVRLALRGGDILVATTKPSGLSARNIVSGTIRGVRRLGMTVALQVDAGPIFDVHVTPHACEALGLHEGATVWLVIKTHSCHPVALDRAAHA
ncbi:MAG: molybdenum ABC transporter ATP-binding protein [Acidimicrobiia bacterium]|nr:molybdenum ABC transporter ATP-binding protein [Acidimicrobiia bacterium]